MWIREELGLKTKSGYNDSGVGKGKDPWRSYESGTTNNPYAYLEDGTNSYSNCQIISRKYNREKWNN